MASLIMLLLLLAIVTPLALAAGFALGVWVEAIPYPPRWVPGWLLTAARLLRDWARRG